MGGSLGQLGIDSTGSIQGGLLCWMTLPERRLLQIRPIMRFLDFVSVKNTETTLEMTE